jgi:hypothetical protein
MHHWVDPATGRGSFVGPYACGRLPGHRGVHAWDGNGAAALWTDSGELIMAVQFGDRQGPTGGLPALLDSDPEPPVSAPEPERTQ